MLSFSPRDVLDELWDLIESFLRVFLPTSVENVVIASILICGWSGGAMVLGKLPVPGRPTI